MKNKLDKNLIFIIFSSFLFSCSQTNRIIDIDLSNLPKPKKANISEKEVKELAKPINKSLIKDLVPFETKEKLSANFKFGKKDPFSKAETKENGFSSNFVLTGFLNTEIEKYVFVSYLGNEGTISRNSVGGLNTNLLPNGAKVLNIDTENKQLKIRFDNEDFIFEL